MIANIKGSSIALCELHFASLGRDTGATFINRKWIADKLNRPNWVWNKSPDECFTEFGGGRPCSCRKKASKSLLLEVTSRKKVAEKWLSKLPKNVANIDVHVKNFPRLKAWKMANADFNVADYDKRTPLHVAASLGYVDVVEYLLENGSDVNVKDAFGSSPLKNATENGFLEIAEMIKNHETLLADVTRK